MFLDKHRLIDSALMTNPEMHTTAFGHIFTKISQNRFVLLAPKLALIVIKTVSI